MLCVRCVSGVLVLCASVYVCVRARTLCVYIVCVCIVCMLSVNVLVCACVDLCCCVTLCVYARVI